MRPIFATGIIALPVLAMTLSLYLWVRRGFLGDSRRQALLSILSYFLIFTFMGWVASPYLLGDKGLLESASIYLPVNALAAVVIALQLFQCHRSLRRK